MSAARPGRALGARREAGSRAPPAVFRQVVQARACDSFYVRTHFELEPSPPSCLGFTRGDVFHVLDTLYPGPGQSRSRAGHWLAVRMGRDCRELERGVIPNQGRCAATVPGACVGSRGRCHETPPGGLQQHARVTPRSGLRAPKSRQAGPAPPGAPGEPCPPLPAPRGAMASPRGPLLCPHCRQGCAFPSL